MRKKAFAIFLCVVFLLSLTGCTGKSSGYSGMVAGVRFALSDLGAEVSIHTPLQEQMIAEIYEAPADNSFLYYVQGAEELSSPLPVTLTWTAEPAESYVVAISKNKNMTDAVFAQATTDNAMEIYNLEIGMTYYWTVTACTGDQQVVSDTASFTIDSYGPRNLYIDGITNVRDVGGWKTADGGSVKQGMIYRCGRLNESSIAEMNIEITDSGIHAFKDVLGVKTELDIRGDEEAANITQSPMGKDVNYIRIPMGFEGDIIQSNAEQIKQVFAVLGQEENYPLCIHCNIGTDRTGLLCFLVNALLGVSETDLVLDYTFSNFGNIGGGRGAEQILDVYLPVLQAVQGDSLSKKTYNFLLDLGVEKTDLNAVISIMKEK